MPSYENVYVLSNSVHTQLLVSRLRSKTKNEALTKYRVPGGLLKISARLTLRLCTELLFVLCLLRGPGSSVGIANDYGLDGPGSNPGGARFSVSPDRPWGPPSLLYKGYRVFSGGKVRPGRAADHSHPSSAAVVEE